MQQPIKTFDKWIKQAEKKCPEHTAMSLATVDADNCPSVRIVLLKDFSEEGFTFYTNLGSRKAQELEGNSNAAICFHWFEIEKQVRIKGSVIKVTDEAADKYYDSRPFQSRLGAWASKQSQPLENTFSLEKRIAEYTAKFATGDIKRPSFWSGFIIQPLEIEFWQKKPFRLHERVVYSRETLESPWTTEKLYP